MLGTMSGVSVGDVLDNSDRREIRPRAPRPGPATLRRDAWWLQPAATAGMLFLFVVYSTWAAFQNGNYYSAPYISPFYSPCIASSCGEHANLAIFGSWWRLSPALLVLIFPLGFRLTCYYYRKAYYRSFWLSPPACAVAEPHGRYTGETRFPLVLQNLHRYFFYFACAFAAILTWDAIDAFHFPSGWGHMGLGTLVLVINASLIWLYTLSCHSCRHLCGGGVNQFSTAPVRYWLWRRLTPLNERHMQLAWASLVWVGFSDVYIRLLAVGAFRDPRFF
jgi:hypothetical protein